MGCCTKDSKAKAERDDETRNRSLRRDESGSDDDGKKRRRKEDEERLRRGEKSDRRANDDNSSNSSDSSRGGRKKKNPEKKAQGQGNPHSQLQIIETDRHETEDTSLRNCECVKTLWVHDKCNLIVAVIALIGACTTISGSVSATVQWDEYIEKSWDYVEHYPWIQFVIPGILTLGGVSILLVGSGLKNATVVAVTPCYLVISGLVVLAFWIVAGMWTAALDLWRPNDPDDPFYYAVQTLYVGLSICALVSMVACCTSVYRYNTVKKNRRKQIQLERQRQEREQEQRQEHPRQ